jgi:precorrin-2 dehydrogenase/sirohydrochlorin ferrochelatase
MPKLIVDFQFEGKYVVMVGGGSEAYKKVLNFLDAGSKVFVVSRNFVGGFRELENAKRVSLLKAEIRDGDSFVKELNPKPDLLAVATSDHDLNAALAKRGKASGFMVYVADNPSLSDFILPAVAKVGEVRIAISTNGKSPAMAKKLRNRIEELITQEDLLQIKLQERMRSILKERVPDQKVRKKIIYRILEDEHVKTLLAKTKLDEAQKTAVKIMESIMFEEQKTETKPARRQSDYLPSS